MHKKQFAYLLFSLSGGVILLLASLAWLSSPPSGARAQVSIPAGSFTDCDSVTGIPASECQALVSIYTTTSGNLWYRKAGWLATDTPCTWEGISCTADHVSILNLQRNNLTGAFPISITSLTTLTELYLNGNWDMGSPSGLTGPIPTELGSMTNLKKLYLNNTELSGSIPPELGNLANLEELNLCENYALSVPAIPPFISSLTHLRYLNLFSLGMAGTIPDELGNLTDFETLILYGNNLSGTIPASLGNLPNLRVLGLNNNLLSGDIPESLMNLGSMEFFSIDYNRLNTSGYSATLVTYLNGADPTWAATQFIQRVVGGTELYTFDTPRLVLDLSPDIITAPITMTYLPKQWPDNGLGPLAYANISFQLTGVYTDGSPLAAFSKPVTITIAYTDTELMGLNENTIHLYFWDTASSHWQDAANTCSPASTYIRLPAENKLSLQICHLTEFAVADLAKVYLPLVRRQGSGAQSNWR